jgi:hypothetical protein
MSGWSRATSSLFVAGALLALPVVLDYCVASCEGAQTLTATTSCHHGSPASPAASVGRASSSCGHDHIASGAEQTSRTEPLRRVFASAVAVVIANPIHDAHICAPIIPHAPPGSSLTRFAQSLPLRI